MASIYLNYKLENWNDPAVEISQRGFVGLRGATGMLPAASEELHLKQFGVNIAIKALKDTGELENLVKEYSFDGVPKRRLTMTKTHTAPAWRQ